MSLLDTRHLHNLRRRSGQARYLQLVDLRRKVRGADVHLLREVLRHDVHHELARAPDIPRRILRDEASRGPVGHAYANNRRVRTEIVVGAEGRGVQPAILVHARHQGYGTRCDKPYQQMVGLTCCCILQIELHGLRLPLSSGAILPRNLSGGTSQPGAQPSASPCSGPPRPSTAQPPASCRSLHPAGCSAAPPVPGVRSR